jgi:hypothetical protein
MADKFTPVTDLGEIEELTKDDADLSKPYPQKPNGHLWVAADDLRAWRILRKLLVAQNDPEAAVRHR